MIQYEATLLFTVHNTPPIREIIPPIAPDPFNHREKKYIEFNLRNKIARIEGMHTLNTLFRDANNILYQIHEEEKTIFGF